MGKIALVTGGTRGIGSATSQALKKEGYRVVATYYSNDEAAKKFSEQYGIEVIKFDVSDFTACENAVKEITAKLGVIEILVNNAGITRDAMLHKMSLEHWQEVITTNLTSCFNMCRVLIPSMREQGFGRVINLTSVNGQKGQVGQVNYSAAKAGVIGLTKALAQEVAAKGITVNAIAPGYIKTEMLKSVPDAVLEKITAAIPVGRLGVPEDVAQAVVFLASDAASFITGATFSINGGQYLA